MGSVPCASFQRRDAAATLPKLPDLGGTGLNSAPISSLSLQQSFDEESGVTQLFAFMQNADRVHFIMGGSLNPSSNHISFKQRGVLPRATIVPLLADKLRAQGKRVIIESV